MRKSLTRLIVLAVALSGAPAFAQSWTAPLTWSTGHLVTAAEMNQQVRDNELVLRAGGFSVTSQAIGDTLCASSTTQFARLAAVATGAPLMSTGTGACPAYAAAPTFSGLTTFNANAAINDAGGSPALLLKNNGTVKGYVGVQAAGAYITGGTANSTFFRSEGVGFEWSADSGSTKHMTLNSGGTFTVYQQNNFSWNTKACDTVYGPANTDGLVVAYVSYTAPNAGSIAGLTDGSNPPTTQRSYSQMQNGAAASSDSITFPAKKGDYWKVLCGGVFASSSVLWVPLGTNP